MKTGYQKRIFSETLSSVGMFDRLAVLVWMDKTKVFDNNYVTELDTIDAHAPIKDGTVYSCMLTDKTNSKNLQVQTKPNTCGRGFRALA